MKAAWGIALLIAGSGVGQCDEIRNRAAGDRPGLHHAELTVRILDAAGKPAGGLEVALAARDAQWSWTPWVLARARTDAAGKASFTDVSTPHTAFGHVEAGEKHLPGSFEVRAVSGQHTDLGDVKLAPNTRITGVLEIVEADGKPAAFKGGTVTLRPKKEDPEQQRYAILASTAIQEWGFALDHLSPPDEDVLVEVRTKVGKNDEIYRGSVRIEKGRIDRIVVLRGKRATLQDPENAETVPFQRVVKEGVLEAAERSEPVGAPPAGRIQGRVVDADGKPIPGCIVAAGAAISLGAYGAGSWALTDAAGTFDIRVPAGGAGRVNVASPLGTRSIDLRTFEGEETGADVREIRIEAPDRANVSCRGAKPEEVAASWDHDGQWLPCPFDFVGRHPPAARDFFGGASYSTLSLRWRAEKKGHVPAAVFLNEPADELVFDFADAAELALTVTSGGRPLPDAHVDVDLITTRLPKPTGVKGWWSDRVGLGRFKTDAQGTLKLLGNPGERYEVHVYSTGREPAWAPWKAKTPLTLDLRRRSVTVRIGGLAAGECAALSPAGSGRLAALVRGATGASPEVALAPGPYDAVVEDAAGRVARGAPVEVAEKGPVSADLAEDRRVRVRVRLPAGSNESDWWGTAARERSAGNRTSWDVVANARAAGTNADAAVESVAGEIVFRLSGTGPHLVAVGPKPVGDPDEEPPEEEQAAGEPLRETPPVTASFALIREIDAGRGKPVEIAVPPLEGWLRGSSRTYANEQGGFFFGGFGSLRLLLLSAKDDPGATGWHVAVPLPRFQRKTGAFEIGPIPAGPYHVFQHLISHGPAWGSTWVEVRKSEPTTIPDFADRELGSLDVEVADASGRPAAGAVIRILDRLQVNASSFIRVVGGRFLAEAAVPGGPAVRLEDGKAVFDPVRGGRTEFEVERDDGRTFRFTRDAVLGETLKITLPR